MSNQSNHSPNHRSPWRTSAPSSGSRRPRTYVYVCTYMYTYVYTLYITLSSYIYIYMYVRMYVYIYIYTLYIYTYIYIYTYTYTYTILYDLVIYIIYSMLLYSSRRPSASSTTPRARRPRSRPHFFFRCFVVFLLYFSFSLVKQQAITHRWNRNPPDPEPRKCRKLTAFQAAY